ncbi:lysozyme [Vibrio crassostreae]|uniref:lysozyme n=1 Tax=Vibrio crassostreae TaxID=246167 RepID=UPI001B3179E3|nr:lysozyme [Vibrio crassostreae]CAK1707452.1 lysozyme [Vibrio crassostreae]CAK2384407.1 lysozyme [Vibrio crassostreae]CAK2444819.1 lysozyme [Vibrio crassostreae]CAK2555536.1 lysozyme [Vibrio crassostreae]CAK2561874.1 lysozyme [Vibrio crassostreae]
MSIKTKAIQAVVCSVASVLAIVFTLDSELTISERGLSHVANEEGCRLKPYQCSADVWTAGLGHTQGVTESTKLTEQKAAELFVKDISAAERVVDKHITQTPNQGEYDMMVSFVFNLGAGNFTRSTLLKKFNQGDHQGACNQYPRWVFVNGKDCRLKQSNCAGIPKRRAKEQHVCLNGW